MKENRQTQPEISQILQHQRKIKIILSRIFFSLFNCTEMVYEYAVLENTHVSTNYCLTVFNNLMEHMQ